MEFTIDGRKIPLEEIRRKTLKEHEPYMREHPDSYYESLTLPQLIDRLSKLHEYNKNETLTAEELRQKLKEIEQTRHIVLWHDNSTVANHGYLVCLAAILYDPTIFLTNEEYKRKTGKTVDIQTIVEKPHIHFIARCRSSEDEQIAYTETRLSCIQETADKMKTLTGTEIHDIVRFFKGDSPAI